MPYKDKNIAREYMRRYRMEQMSAEQKARAHRRVQERKAELVEFVRNTKREKSCVECGESRWQCLDYHHTGDKEFGLDAGTLSKRGYGKKRILAEIAKCVVLCANCHRLTHSQGSIP